MGVEEKMFPGEMGQGRIHSLGRRWAWGGDESLGMDSGWGGSGFDDGSMGRRWGWGEGRPGG